MNLRHPKILEYVKDPENGETITMLWLPDQSTILIYTYADKVPNTAVYRPKDMGTAYADFSRYADALREHYEPDALDWKADIPESTRARPIRWLDATEAGGYLYALGGSSERWFITRQATDAGEDRPLMRTKFWPNKRTALEVFTSLTTG